MQPLILFEDPNVLVVSKPAGLLSQPDDTSKGAPVPSIVDWARDYLGRPYVGLVHRLDRNTSGALLIAKRTKAARRLTDALQGGHVRRTYLSVFGGKLSDPFFWENWMKKDSKKNKSHVSSQKKEGFKKAILVGQPIRSLEIDGNPFTAVHIRLETGRPHQIRAQSSYHGHPVLGDAKYDGYSEDWILKRPALHSYSIEFPHPISKEILSFQAPVPEELKDWLEGDVPPVPQPDEL